MTKKVIIIDDSLISLNLIKTAFAGAKWEVYGSQHAQNALEMLYDIAPDLIVTDAVMPIMGGFQLLKELRNNPKTSKIPVIIYSVLDDKNSKFYIKNERAEYYLQKNENTDELLKLASEVVEKHPLSDDYKFEILKTNLQLNDIIETSKEPEIELNKPQIEFDELEAQFKEKYDFTRSDDKILGDVFNILYPILEYDLAVICTHSFEKNEKIVYFDIRDIILSPIFQNDVLHEQNAKNSFLFKKYAPNLKIITNEEEFLTKVKFDFEYNNEDVGNIIFYSKEKSKWINNSNLETIKSVLANFFRARYINKSSHASKTNDISSKYFIERLDFKFDSQSNRQMYTAVIEIANYKDLQDNLSLDSLDYINSKISEKLINFISNEEQIFKNDEDEYNLVFYAKDETHAIQKLGWVIDLINEIELDENKIEILIGASDCKIDGQFNFYEAQKYAHEALDKANSQNRIVIYGTK